MRQGTQDTVQRLGSSSPATFQCTVSGVPQPEIKWIHREKELDQSRSNVSVARSPSGFLVTSELKMRDVVVEDTGAVQCVGYHAVGGRVSATASGANLIVLRKCIFVFVFTSFVCQLHQEFITIRVCDCHSVSATTISAVWQ